MKMLLRRGKSAFLMALLIALFSTSTSRVVYAAEEPDRYIEAAQKIRHSVVSLKITLERDVPVQMNDWARYWLGEKNVKCWMRLWARYIKHERFIETSYAQRAGTGLIVGSKGLVLTNEHLVRRSVRIDVLLAGGEEVSGRLIAADPWIDLALVHIPVENLQVPVFADSDTVQVGQEVLSVGNALGFNNTVSRGIISGQKRFVRDEFGRIFENVFQTDAAVNFGDSGGPLIDLNGAVVGLKLAIVPQGQNISFAMPTNTFRSVLPELLTTGSVKRGWIGLYVSEIVSEDRKSLIVDKIFTNSPSEQAGVQLGDSIVGVDGKLFSTPEDFYRWIRGRTPGDTVTLRIERSTGPLVRLVSVAASPEVANSDPVPEKQLYGVRRFFERYVGENHRWTVILALLLSMWLALRIYGLKKRRSRTAPERRYGERRKGERRKGERRKHHPQFAKLLKAIERRKSERRGDFRRKDRDRRI